MHIIVGAATCRPSKIGIVFASEKRYAMLFVYFIGLCSACNRRAADCRPYGLPDLTRHKRMPPLLLCELAEHASIFIVEGFKGSVFDGGAHFCGQVVIEIEVMQYAEPHAEAFVGLEQVADIGP